MVQRIKRDEISKHLERRLGPSPWFKVTQDQIDQFADCINDHQFIHVDPEAAKNGPFGCTVAHGFLSLSMLSYLCGAYSLRLEGAHTFINYGLDKVRFLTPVRVNSHIRAWTKVIAIEEKSPNHFVMRSEVELEIEDEEKPALVAEWITMQVL